MEAGGVIRQREIDRHVQRMSARGDRCILRRIGFVDGSRDVRSEAPTEVRRRRSRSEWCAHSRQWEHGSLFVYVRALRSELRRFARVRAARRRQRNSRNRPEAWCVLVRGQERNVDVDRVLGVTGIRELTTDTNGRSEVRVVGAPRQRLHRPIVERPHHAAWSRRSNRGFTSNHRSLGDMARRVRDGDDPSQSDEVARAVGGTVRRTLWSDRLVCIAADNGQRKKKPQAKIHRRP